MRDVVLDAGPVLDLAEAMGVLPEAVRPALLDVREAAWRVVVGNPRPPADGNPEERADPIVDREFGPHLALRRHQLPEPRGRTQYRTIVLRPLRMPPVASNSYQLFERCARVLTTISRVIARGRIADVREHRLFLIGADIAQR
jgi:hypothetical protein